MPDRKEETGRSLASLKPANCSGCSQGGECKSFICDDLQRMKTKSFIATAVLLFSASFTVIILMIYR